MIPAFDTPPAWAAIVRGLTVEACIDGNWAVQRCTTANAILRGISPECRLIGFWDTRDDALTAARENARDTGLPIMLVDPPGFDPTVTWKGSAA